MVFAFHRSKNRSAFLSEPNLAWFEWRELSILDRLESGPRSCSALQDLGRTSLWEQHRCHLGLLLSSRSPPLQAFTREGKRPDQMGSVIRCYYSTDRARFSSWSYLKEKVESLCCLRIVEIR